MRIYSPTMSSLCLRLRLARLYSTTNPAAAVSPATASLISVWKSSVTQRIDTTVDHINPSTFNLLATTLDDPLIPYKGENNLPPADTPLPPNWHLAYFPPRVLERDLASDGYEDSHAPPEPFVRRMWAGGKLEFKERNPLRIGQEARVVTKCKDVEVKRGARGENVFVWVEKEIGNGHGWCVRDTRCLVYMKPPGKGGEKVEQRVIRASKTPAFMRTIHPTPILLFRYSALTFNSHQIHYDYRYTTEKEGRPACLVHGPLTCTLLLDLLRANINPMAHIRSFTYRALTPMYAGTEFRLCGRPNGSAEDKDVEGTYELWAENEHGGLAMSGTAEVVERG
ncbi:hypothetical protein BC936DRAFT_138361 [Jimgerdemannia flammicorona]|uniref:N-terminal of MaoC-like dehydratase domain-containing protein n=1 Tax=Jimgerdemannia flammicorona TaxID=994334 RepID=A0A433DMU9_9FUNG|nr:hypothetical protein BC936DRAFT_138361 [Jimgerdemannia flammicorona]